MLSSGTRPFRAVSPSSYWLSTRVNSPRNETRVSGLGFQVKEGATKVRELSRPPKLRKVGSDWPAKLSAAGKALHPLDRARHRALDPAEAEAARLKVDVAGRRQRRLPGDDVDQAAGFAAPVQHRGRAFQHLDPLHVGEIAGDRREVAGLVQQYAVDGVGLGPEAADDEGVAPALDRAPGLDAADILQGIAQPDVLLIDQHFAGHHLHRLRRVAQGRVGPGRGRRAGGAVADHRTAGPLHRGTIAGDAQFREDDLLGLRLRVTSRRRRGAEGWCQVSCRRNSSTRGDGACHRPRRSAQKA